MHEVFVRQGLTLAGLTAAMALAACAAPSAPPPQALIAPDGRLTVPRQQGQVVLGHLVSRETVTTITQSQAGPRFTVRDKTGKILARDLTAANLAARAPEVHRTWHEGLADVTADLTGE